MKWVLAAMLLLALLPLDPLILGGELVLVLYAAGVLSYVLNMVLHLLHY